MLTEESKHSSQPNLLLVFQISLKSLEDCDTKLPPSSFYNVSKHFADEKLTKEYWCKPIHPGSIFQQAGAADSFLMENSELTAITTGTMAASLNNCITLLLPQSLSVWLLEQIEVPWCCHWPSVSLGWPSSKLLHSPRYCQIHPVAVESLHSKKLKGEETGK